MSFSFQLHIDHNHHRMSRTPLIYSICTAVLLLTNFGTCIHVTYPGIGTFHMGEFYDFFNRPFIDLQLPDPPEEQNVNFYLYTRLNPFHNVSLRWNNSEDIINSDYLNDSLPFKMLIHGYINSENEAVQDEESWMVPLKDAMLRHANLNVILVYWRNRFPYERSSVNTRVVGPMVAVQIQAIIAHTNATLDSFHLVGHSLGAHISGYAGKFLGNGRLGMITGLDVARIHFENIDTRGRLWHTDAKFVEAIHTDATMTGFGMIAPCAHVDIYPNSGSGQPGCEALSSFSSLVNTVSKFVTRCVRCDHHRANDYYIEAWEKALYPEMITAVACTSYADYKEKQCMSCGIRGEKCITLGPASIDYTTVVAKPIEPLKQFFITTASKKPYFRQPCLSTLKKISRG